MCTIGGDTYDLKFYERAFNRDLRIDNYFNDIVNAYKDAACESFPTRKNMVKYDAQVVGWSDFVHDLHRIS